MRFGFPIKPIQSPSSEDEYDGANLELADDASSTPNALSQNNTLDTKVSGSGIRDDFYVLNLVTIFQVSRRHLSRRDTGEPSLDGAVEDNHFISSIYVSLYQFTMPMLLHLATCPDSQMEVVDDAIPVYEPSEVVDLQGTEICYMFLPMI